MTGMKVGMRGKGGSLRAGLARTTIAVLLLFSLVLNSFIFNLQSAYAASSPWTQTDWSGGSGQTAWSDATKFSTSSNSTTSTVGEATLTNTESLTNTGFESNLNSWSYSADQTLTVSGNEITDAVRTTNTSGDGVTPPDSSFGIWQATTNLVTNGGFETNVGVPWTGWGTATLTRITSDSKFGSASLQSTSLAAAVTYTSISPAETGAPIAQTARTYSAWVKGVGVTIGKTITIRLQENGGAFGQQSTVTSNYTLTSSWQRILVTGTPIRADRTTINFDTYWTAAGAGEVVLFDGVQVETGSIATPYVETNGGTAARSAASVHVPSSIINPTQFWFAARLRMDWASGTSGVPSSGAYLFNWRDDGTHRIEVSYTTANSKWNMIRVNPINGHTLSVSNTFTAGSYVTVVVYWTATTQAMSINGANFSTFSDTFVPTMAATFFSLGDQGGAGWIDSDVLWAATGVGTLTDADASTINALGNTDPGINSIPSTASTSAIWTADTSTYTAGSVSRDTSTTYSSSIGSAKVISSLTTGNFTQSVNVGDTNTYALSAYAYTDGSAVTSSDLSLLYNGSTISTSYSSVGSGWYKLSGTLTGANASRNYGVQLASGKTVFVDNMSLNRYATSGTLTSSIFDAENTDEGSNWGALTYSATTPANTSVSVKVRTSNSSTMTGATDFSSCTAITSDSDISSNSCVTDGHRYIQYQVTLSTTDTGSSTPTFQDISIAFSQRDTTAPVSVELDSPGNNSYTNNERPTFKWKTTTDATAGLSKYVLEIDNPSIGSDQPSGDFTIDNIPTSGTTEVTNNKYVIHFDGFSDSDSANNYISVFTRSAGSGQASEWGANENDGKLREGKVSWKVKATDNVGNETSTSRTLLVDKTSPNAEFTQINSVPFSTSSNNNFSTTDKTPTIFGKLTDSLSGADNNGETKQAESGPKVASGPKEVNIKVEKVEKVLGLASNNKLITLYTINMDKPFWTCGNKEVTDNSKQDCSKYLPFSYTPGENLDYGTYKITLTGKDKADNSSAGSGQVLTLNITTFAQIATSEEKKNIEEETKNLTPSQKKEFEQNQEITKPIEPNVFEKAGNALGNLVNTIARGTLHLIGSGFVFVGGQISSSANTAIGVVNLEIGYVKGGVATVGQGYSAITNVTPGIAKDVLTNVGNGASDVASTIGNAGNQVVNNTRGGITNIAFTTGEKVQDISGTVGVAIIKFTYNFVPEPTKISDVKIIVLSPTSAKVSWQTNHPANGKVNWGFEDGVYKFEDQADKKTTNHEFSLTNLKPDTQYHYEVMSQNKNYVYDANRKFKTPAK